MGQRSDGTHQPQPHRQRSRVWRVAAVAATCAALVASCNDDSGQGATSTTDPATTVPAGAVTEPDSATVPASTTSAPDAGATTPSSSTSVPPTPGVELPPLLENADGNYDALNGVGRLEGQGADCTAFLVDTGAADAPAFALTNGHCVGIFDSDTVIVDGPGGGTVAFNRFVDTDDLEVAVASVRWATMRGVDLAVLELDRTLGELRADGIAAYTLRPPPLEGSEIRVVGVPVTGIPDGEWFLRASDCAAGHTTRLLEFTWVWDAVQANDCDAVVGGNSGSPVFDASGDVVGVINTTTVAAGPGGRCYLGRPCEVTAAGAEMFADTSYAMPVDGIARCFTGVGGFDRTACGIEADPPAATLSIARPQQQSPATWDLEIVHRDADGIAPESSTPTTVDPDAAPVLAGTVGEIGSTDCRDDVAYTPTASDTYAALPPGGEGFYLACLAPLRAGRVDTQAASYAILQVDDTPPEVAPELSITELGDGFGVEPVFATPELSDFQLKVEPAADVDCDDPAGYVRYRRIPVHVGADELPAAVCVIGSDLADNAGDPARFELP